MMSKKMQFVLRAGMLTGIAAVLSCCVRAQAPPGPLAPAPSQDPAPVVAPQPKKAPVQPRTSILGNWTLNRDDSDDPRDKMQQARGSGGNRGNSRMGVGFPGGGIGGPYGGGRRSGSGESDADREKMAELMSPSRVLTLAEATKDVEVDVFDDQQRKNALFTDGRKVEKSKDANYQEISAKWDGKRLVTDEKKPGGGKMSRSFELSYDGTQMYETLHLTEGRSNSPVVIRYVYDIGTTGAAPAATAPAGTTLPGAPAAKQ
jgi:hypothetical protein